MLVAIITAPVLQRMGCTLLQAHFFAFYFACMAFLTPPEAMAALVASKLAGASFMRTGWESCLVGLAGFLVPFLGIWAPVVMLAPQSIAGGMVDLALILAMLIAAQAAICDHYLTPITITERVTLGAVPVVLMAFFIYRIQAFAIVAALAFVVVTIWQIRKRRAGRLGQTVSA